MPPVNQPLVTVIIGARVGRGAACQRLRNLTTCLTALAGQDIKSDQYRIVLVEQDREPQLGRFGGAAIDTYVFAYNPGPFNRSWGLNIGANTSSTGVLCLLDADMIVPDDFVARGLTEWSAGAKAIRPFREMLYLNAVSSEEVINLVMTRQSVDPSRYRGRLAFNSQGGCLWIDTSLYHHIGGYDERFEGWGWEDREFWHRLSTKTSIVTLDVRLLHLDHPREDKTSFVARANGLHYHAVKAGLIRSQSSMKGDLTRYTLVRRQ